MTTIDELKETAYQISPYAYIAGGFYKDIRNGVEPKDIDVFMCSKDGYDTVIKILEKITGCIAEKKKASVSIGKYELIKPVTIADRDLFGLPQYLVPTFDIDIARVYIDTTGLYSTDDLEEINFNIDNKFFTVSIFHGDEQRSFDRAKRYESYGYTKIGTDKMEHICSSRTHNGTMSGGYSND